MPLCELKCRPGPEKWVLPAGQSGEKFISIGDVHSWGGITLIYYRVAFRAEQPATWKWRSTALTSLQALLLLLRTYSNMPKDRIRVFFSSSEEDMEEMLNRQNHGLVSSSVTAEQLLAGKKINALEVKRLELELNMSADHDAPYIFTLPTSAPQIHAWTELMMKVQRGEIES